MGRKYLVYPRGTCGFKVNRRNYRNSKKGVTDETYQQVKEYYTDKEIAQIIIAINHMNFLNRVGVTSKLRV